MKRINIGRVVLGGLVAGVVFIIVELVFEGLARLLFRINETDLLLQAFGSATTRGAAFHIINVGYLFVYCILGVWLYAAIRPRFGAGPKTAIIAALIVWFIYALLLVNLVNLNIFPLGLGLISLLFNLVELPAAFLAGATVYKED